ncbi:hypothetical protein ACIQVT_29595 [Streptomyces sp. NPDC100445]
MAVSSAASWQKHVVSVIVSTVYAVITYGSAVLGPVLGKPKN